MGTELFWFFDLAVIALLIIFLYKGFRKGFVSILIGFVAMVVAFVIALPISGAVADGIYNNVVKNAVSDEINSKLESVLSDSVIRDLKNVDMKKAKINGKELSSVTFTPNNMGMITLDLTKLDLSETGIDKANLSAFGIDGENVNYSSVNLGSVEITANERETYGIEKMILASVLTDNILKGEAFSAINEALDKMSDHLPSFMSDIADSVSSGDKEMIHKIMLCAINTDTGSLSEAITDSMVKPVLLVPMRALIFLVLFVIIVLILNLAAKMLKGINHIPLVGGINKLLGAAAGIAQGAVVIFLVCIFVQVVISLSGNELIFLNTMTIDKTFLFQKVYYFDYINFMA